MEENENKSRAALSVVDLSPGHDASKRGRSIFVLICTILALTTIIYGAVDLWALGLLTIFVAIIACVWAFDAWNKRELRFSASVLQLPLIALAVLGAIQLLPFGGDPAGPGTLAVPASRALSLDPYSTRIFVIQMLVYAVFFAAALTWINHRDRVKRVVYFIVIFVAVMAFYGILQKLGNVEGIYGLRETEQAVPFGSFVNQHHFAALMEMASGLALGLIFGKSTKRANRPLLVIAAVMMGIAIIFTGSRGGLLSFGAVITFIFAGNFFLSRKDDEDEKSSIPGGKLMPLIGGAALVLGMFAAVLLLGGDQSVLRGIGLGETTQLDFTTGRTHFWSVALQIFFHNPVLGAGFNAFGNAYPIYDSWNGSLRVEQAHNDYLQMLSDGGLLAFAAVLVFIYFLFKTGLKTARESRDTFRRNTVIGSLAGCFGILIHSFFDFPLRTPANAFFFLTLAALAVVPIYYPKKHRRDD